MARPIVVQCPANDTEQPLAGIRLAKIAAGTGVDDWHGPFIGSIAGSNNDFYARIGFKQFLQTLFAAHAGHD